MISGFPVAKEDVALIVDDDVPAAAVERALRAGAGPLLESIWLFDVYTGTQVGEGKKSLAYALRFRAPDRTLTDAEAAEARDAAVAVAAERTEPSNERSSPRPMSSDSLWSLRTGEVEVLKRRGVCSWLRVRPSRPG